jgi:hypothetical protein
MTASAAFVAHQLERLRSFWPNLPVSQVALDEWCDVFGPFAENEISAGVRHIIHTYSEMAAPKPSHLIAAIRRAEPESAAMRKVRNNANVVGRRCRIGSQRSGTPRIVPILRVAHRNNTR